MDPIVVLTPVLVVALVLLLGFAGCEFEGKVGPADPADPSNPTLTIRARVPKALTVTEVFFSWESPTVPQKPLTVMNPLPDGSDGEDNFFQRTLNYPETEAWTMRCQVTVQGGATPGPRATGTYMHDGSFTFPVGTFQAIGGAADLDLTYTGTK